MSGKLTAFGQEAIPTVSEEQNNIHAGHFFSAYVHNSSLAAAALLYIEMRIPAGIEVHLKQSSFYNSDKGFFKLTEVSSYTPGSVPITPYNRDRRNIPKKTNLVLMQNPSGIGGAGLDEMYFDGTQQSPGILMSSDWEWILKDDSVYILSLRNDGSSASIAILRANWYEHVIAQQ